MPNVLTQHERLIERKMKPMQLALTRWMMRRAREEAAKQIAQLRKTKSGLWTVSKSVVVAKASGIDEELLDILMRYGVAQAEDASIRATTIPALRYILDPKRLRTELEAKDFRLKVFTILDGWATKHVKQISADTKNMVKDSIARILQEAASEMPVPSVGEMARRIRTQFHGDDVKGRIYAWSPERAALIARTELVQAEGTGAQRSYLLIEDHAEERGFETRKRWLAKTFGKIWPRRHDKMNNVTVKLKDDFVMPDGERMQYPGDPGAPIGHLANCQCAHRVVFFKNGREV